MLGSLLSAQNQWLAGAVLSGRTGREGDDFLKTVALSLPLHGVMSMVLSPIRKYHKWNTLPRTDTESRAKYVCEMGHPLRKKNGEGRLLCRECNEYYAETADGKVVRIDDDWEEFYRKDRDVLL